MAMFADNGAAAKHGPHVNHGARANDRTDVDDRAHHDHGIVANFHLVSNDGARLDSGVHVAHVKQRHTGVATVVLNDHVENGVPRRLKRRPNLGPLAKDHDVARPKDVGTGAKVHMRARSQLDVRLDRRLLWRARNKVNDFLGVHGLSPLASHLAVLVDLAFLVAAGYPNMSVSKS